MSEFLAPDPSDELVGPHWRAAAAGHLVAQGCSQCGYVRWPPAPRCPECLSHGANWTRMSRTGTVWSYAVYHRALHPAFATKVPYTVALVELPEGPLMVGTVLTTTGDADFDGELTIGQRVRAEFEPVATGGAIVRWRPEVHDAS